MAKTTLITMMIVLSTCLPGCIPKQKVIDDIELPQILSIDSDGKSYKGAILIPRYKAMGDTEFKLIDTVSSSNYDLIPRINRRTKHQIEKGQLGMVLLGNDYSEKGIGDQLQSLTRDPKIPSMLQLGVAEGNAAELLDIIQKSGEPFFLTYMVEQNINNGNLPMMNLHEALFNYYGEGRDMFLPFFKKEQGEVKIDGLALFRKDKKIININNEEAFLLNLLLNHAKVGRYMVPGTKEALNEDPEKQILIHINKSKVSKHVKIDESAPSISIRLKMNVKVEEIPDLAVLKSKAKVTKLEKKMGNHFEKEIQTLLSFFQENNVDPVGFGDLVRHKSKDLNSKELSEMYPEINTHVRVDVTINQSGTTE
jgi:spore germination protein